MITIESLAFLLMGWVSGRLLTGGFIGSFFAVHPQFMLSWQMTIISYAVDMISIGAFLVAIYRQANGWTAAQRYRWYRNAGIILVVTVWSFSLIGRLGYGTTYGAHDGVVESEVAAEMLMQGRNPYAADFAGSAFEVFHRVPPGQPPSPILQAYPYPPLIPVLTIPFVWLGDLLNVPVDGRWLTVLCFGLFSWLLLRFARDTTPRLWLVLGLLFNAFAFALPIAGLNDIVFVLGLTLTGVALYRRRWVWSAVALAVAIAAKQTAVVALPLWLWWLWLEYQRSAVSRRTVWQAIGSGAGVTALLFGPFLLWNAPAMYDDLVRFVGGMISRTYPVGGDSIWQTLVILEKLPDKWSPTKHSLTVVIAMVVGLIVGGYWLWRRRSASQWLTSTVFVTLLTSITNRFFFDNYAAALFLMGVTILVLDWRERHPSVVSPEQSR